MEKNTTCRGCGKLLEGNGTQGNAVYDPETMILAKWNHFGGWVCSEQCDYNSCLELERSMLGHIGQRSLSTESASYRQVKTNWKEANK